jgi:Glycosyl hydrolase family 79 C-terminal beta domain
MIFVLPWGPYAAVLLAGLVTLLGAAPAVAEPLQVAATASPTAGVTVGSPSAIVIPEGFLGLSFELTALENYAGTSPAALNPVFLQLVRNLTPGQRPVLRIGGDSTDWTWYPVPGMKRPPWVRYTLTPAWLSVAHSVASAVNARLILGVNLESDSVRIADAEAAAMVQAIGAPAIEALELGNEPELYGSFNWYRDPRGTGVRGRGPGYDFATFSRQFDTVAKTLSGAPVAGPAIGSPIWSQSLGAFAAANHKVSLLTLHRYALKRCQATTTVTPTELLAESSTRGLAAGLAPEVAAARRAHDPLRIDETNSVTCRGEPGVSNTFASALWALDALFALAHAGVSGVNVHTVPNAAYQLFSFQDGATGWTGRVEPDYYGLLMFAEAAPAGAHLLSLTGTTTGAIRAWASRAPDGTDRVVVINTRARGAPEQFGVTVPHATATAALTALSAPGLTATAAVTLGGQSFGASTATGLLTGAPVAPSVLPADGRYRFAVPPASAVLLTVPVSRLREQFEGFAMARLDRGKVASVEGDHDLGADPLS